MKKYVAVAIIMMLLPMNFLMPVAKAKSGFGPAEIFCSNHKDTMIMGTASLINGDDVPKYGVFSLIMPYSDSGTWQVVSTEIIHARVVCMDCNEGMQRWEAIPGYEYGMVLEGNCTECDSNDLLFYETMPRDEFNMLSIEGAGSFDFEKVPGKDYTWVTKQQISPHRACNVNVLFDASESYILENFDKHWEFHLRGNTQLNKEVKGYVGGGDLRILMSFKFPLYIEIVSPINKGENFTIRVTYGDDEESWGELPAGGIDVTFNGETLTADENGFIQFTYPDTRGDYEYKITADAGDDYIPATVTLTTDKPDNPVVPPNEENSNFFTFDNPLFLAIIVSIVVIIVGIVWKRRKPKKKKSSKDW